MLSVSGCGSLAYYAQSVRGQLGVMAATRPVEDVLDDPTTPSDVRERLAQLDRLRRFAVKQLWLPDSGSYRSYADLRREAMVWSVFAAPFDSLEPKTWCYPFVGCANYRGYFRRADAEAFAEGLAAQGLDTAVEPVPAYSTLGWFSDPLPSTVVHWPLPDMAGLIFHELAHERLYLAGDSAFNEAYASVVERAGVARWLQHFGTPRARRDHTLRQGYRKDFLALLAHTRKRLETLYAERTEAARVKARKRAILQRMGDEYVELKERWGGFAGYDRWFARPLNNAHLISVSTYNAWVPAFEQLLHEVDSDMRAFHRACERLADVPRDRRETYLREAVERAALSTDALNADSVGATD